MTPSPETSQGPSTGSLDAHAIRSLFPILRSGSNPPNLAYLDNASTTQKPSVVIESLQRYYEQDNANVHRGNYALAERSTEAYEEARRSVASFIGAGSESEIIFTRGTTESINLVAQSWGDRSLSAGDEILLSPMEHHSNLVPWQLLAQRTGARLRFLALDAASGTLDLSQLEQALRPNVRLLALTHISNVLGTINPIRRLVQEARHRGIVTLIDAAQSVGHLPIHVQKLGCDFLAFSGHKMYGPTGIGVLYGKAELLSEMEPWQAGGEMVESVEWNQSHFSPPPHRFEAGTPPIAAAIGLGSAIGFIRSLGLEALERSEALLTTEALGILRGLPFIRILGNAEARAGVISFVVEGVHAQDVVMYADLDQIALRAGHHCAQPLLKSLGISSCVRASLACYNTPSDIQRLGESLLAMHRRFHQRSL